MGAPEAIIEELCPNCGGEVTASRLESVGVCSSCLPGKPPASVVDLLELLERSGRLLGYREVYALIEGTRQFGSFFERVTGKRMWSMQEVWARRLVRGESFAIVAPTGLGKTIFGSVAAVYVAARGGRSYIIVPTSLLAEQVAARVRELADKASPSRKSIKVVAFHAGLKQREKREALEAVRKRKFDILITTDRFLSTHFDALRRAKFDLVFVDDVDALLRASKNVDKVLMLVGFKKSLIEEALRAVSARKAEVQELLASVKKKAEEAKGGGSVGQLLVSGATIRARRTKRLRLFQTLLGFEVTVVPTYVRNVEDLYVRENDVMSAVVELVKKLGKGGLIFVPSSGGLELAAKIHERLLANGVKSYLFDRMRAGVLDKFVKGEFEVLVGVASTRSPLSRGIDLPETVRYAIFAGVPRVEVRLSPETYSPGRLITILKAVREVVEDKNVVFKVDEAIAKLGKFVGLSRDAVAELEEAAAKGVKPRKRFLRRAFEVVEAARSVLKEVLTPEILQRLSESVEVSVKEVAGELFMVIPDPASYIQSSGRTSRLYAGGISKGISILVVDDEKAFNGLKRRVRWYIEELRWRDISEVDLDALVAEVDRDREMIRKIARGEIEPGEAEALLKAALLVVESPNKARTIARLFGKPARRTVDGLTVYETVTEKFILTVAASGGHVFDLITQEERGFHGIYEEDGAFTPVFGPIKKCRNCGEQFVSASHTACPVCGSTNIVSKSDVIRALRKLASEVNVVLIGTDPDMEGEKIAWDLALVLAPYNPNIARVRFHEVTRRGLREALSELGSIDLGLVKAQLVRRIEDRWVGFELSRRLWNRFGIKRLSAGRVQTPVLGWVIRRYEKSKKKRVIFTVELENKLRLRVEKEKGAVDEKEYLNLLKTGWVAEEISVAEVERNPPPPFTTDEMLRVAAAEMKLPAGRIMSLAQELFELGLITYHRTDSTRVSTRGMEVAKDYIIDRFGDESLFRPRAWEITGPGIQAAHECIRPTRPIDVGTLMRLVRTGIYRFPRRLTPSHYKLYDLIFKRFVASQMDSAVIRVQKVRLTNSATGESVELDVPFEVVKEGFTKILAVWLRPRIEPGTYSVVSARKRTAPAVYLFTEGELVAEMKKRRIGRPSTYARIIDTLKEEGYVREYGGRLVPTKLGVEVYEYLSTNFGRMVSEELTRDLEELTDKVRSGEVDYLDALRSIRGQVAALPEAV